MAARAQTSLKGNRGETGLLAAQVRTCSMVVRGATDLLAGEAMTGFQGALGQIGSFSNAARMTGRSIMMSSWTTRLVSM